MPDRYYSDTPITSERVVLSGPEAHHLIHVMRAAAGMRVVLFDGSGGEFPATVERVGRSDVTLAVAERCEIDRELPLRLTLAVALPKGERQKWLVEKAVELGVTRLVPLRTQRGVAQPVEQALERLRRTVVEASKQCGRNRLMEIAPPAAWRPFVTSPDLPPRRLVAHPGGRTLGDALKACETMGTGSEPLPEDVAKTASREVPVPIVSGPSSDTCCAVGPEGGFSDEEIDCATAAGWQRVDLGPRILRVETAAIFLASLLAGACRTA